MKSFTLYALVGVGALMLLSAAMFGCESITGGEAKTGKLVVGLTDAPIDGVNVTAVEVTISQVRIHIGEAEGTETSGKGGGSNSEGEGGTWKTILEGPETFNLMTLTDAREVLGEAELEEGIYTQIRLEVQSASVTIDGMEYPLTVSSGSVKLVNAFEVRDEETTELTLDFDAQESVILTGVGGPNPTYIMKPVIRIDSVKIGGEEKVGWISGHVTPADSGAVVSAYGDGERVAEDTICEKNGHYKLGLPVGTYDIVFTATGYADVQLAGIEVVAGEESSGHDVTLTPQ
ncbi:MAG: DUF4382 domain-containing protein [bacterium]